jgi:D-alanyl-D-alanine carboxypeptidase
LRFRRSGICAEVESCYARSEMWFRPISHLIWLSLVSVVGRADAVDDLIRAEMQKQRIPGLAMAVVRDGKLLRADGYGLANVELNVAAKPETMFKIGSVSKQFLAIACVLLAEDNKLRPEDRLADHLDNLPESWKKITIRQLITHTSGLPRESKGYDGSRQQNEMDVARAMFAVPLEFAPGERYQYSNLGYFVLAAVVAKVSGQPWAEFISDRLFKPSEMAVSRTTTVREIVPNRAAGYRWDADKMTNADHWPAVRPSGAFMSNVLDLAKWEVSLQAEKILPKRKQEQLFQPTKLKDGNLANYGLGYQLGRWNNHRTAEHFGTMPGFSSLYLRLLDDRIGIILLTNGQDLKLTDLSRAIAAQILPPTVKLSAKREAKSDGRKGTP